MKRLVIYPTFDDDNDSVILHASIIRDSDDKEDTDVNQAKTYANSYKATGLGSDLIKQIIIHSSNVLEKIMEYFPDFVEDCCTECDSPTEIQAIDFDLALILSNVNLLGMLAIFETGRKKYSEFLSAFNDECAKEEKPIVVMPYPDDIEFDLYDKIREECKTNIKFRSYILNVIDEICVALKDSNNDGSVTLVYDIRISTNAYDSMYYHMMYDNLTDDEKQVLVSVKNNLTDIMISSLNYEMDGLGKFVKLINHYASYGVTESPDIYKYRYISDVMIENPNRTRDTTMMFSSSRPSYETIKMLSEMMGIQVYVYEMRGAIEGLDLLDTRNVYEIRGSFDIEQSPVYVDYCGHIVSTRPIKFKDTDFIPLDALRVVAAKDSDTSLTRFFVDTRSIGAKNYSEKGEVVISSNYLRES